MLESEATNQTMLPDGIWLEAAQYNQGQTRPHDDDDS